MRWIITTNIFDRKEAMYWRRDTEAWTSKASEATRFDNPRDAMLSLVATQDDAGWPTVFNCEIHIVKETN